MRDRDPERRRAQHDNADEDDPALLKIGLPAGGFEEFAHLIPYGIELDVHPISHQFEISHLRVGCFAIAKRPDHGLVLLSKLVEVGLNGLAASVESDQA